MDYQKEWEVAIGAVVKACQLCERVQQGFLGSDALEKGDRSPVTVADFGAQAIVGHALARAFPRVPLVAEEDAGELVKGKHEGLLSRVAGLVHEVEPELHRGNIPEAIGRGGFGGGAQGRFWTLDPVDGTKGFLRGGQYAVALALIEEGQVVLGVLGCPHLLLNPAMEAGPRGCLFYAVRGGGAFVRPIKSQGRGRAVRVSGVSDPAAMVWCESVESSHSSHGEAEQIAARLGVVAPSVRMDSQCKYGAVARGEASVYLRLPTSADYREKIWDHAAGVLLVEEAGGRVCDVEGRKLDFSSGRSLSANRGVVAAAGGVFDAVLAAVRDCLG